MSGFNKSANQMSQEIRDKFMAKVNVGVLQQNATDLGKDAVWVVNAVNSGELAESIKTKVSKLRTLVRYNISTNDPKAQEIRFGLGKNILYGPRDFLQLAGHYVAANFFKTIGLRFNQRIGFSANPRPDGIARYELAGKSVIPVAEKAALRQEFAGEVQELT